MNKGVSFIWMLFALLGIFNVIDIYTTYIGVVELGAVEANPLVSWALSYFIEPLDVLIAGKMLSMLGTGAMILWLINKGRIIGTIRTLLIVNFIMTFVVIWNTSQILRIF